MRETENKNKMFTKHTAIKYILVAGIILILSGAGIYAQGLMTTMDKYKLFSTSKQKIVATYDNLLNNYNNGNALKDVDNTCGVLTWGESYVLKSLLEMYKATKNTKYIDKFIEHADTVLSHRSDKLGIKDWEGKLRKGWLTNSEFTLGMPIILKDSNGNPSLEIQPVRFAYNNQTEIKVTPDMNNYNFNITVSNPQDNKTPKSYTNLTMNKVEQIINEDNQGQFALIRVKKLCTNIPALTTIMNPTTAKVALHGHHTAVILAPYAEFNYLVKSNPNLAKYKNKADKYQKAIIESMDDYENTWVDKGNYGYYIFEKGIPFWSDGVEEPYNANSYAGKVFLYLYLSTGEEKYKARANKIANLIKKGLIKEPNGSYVWYYWFGHPSNGWNKETNISKNLSFYPPNKAMEDTSHAQSVISFINDCYENNLFFKKEDIKALVNTFNKNILLNKVSKPFLSDTVNGKGKGNYDNIHYGFIKLSKEDKSIWNQLLWINMSLENDKPEVALDIKNNPSVILLDWASLARYY